MRTLLLFFSLFSATAVLAAPEDENTDENSDCDHQSEIAIGISALHGISSRTFFNEIFRKIRHY